MFGIGCLGWRWFPASVSAHLDPCASLPRCALPALLRSADPAALPLLRCPRCAVQQPLGEVLFYEVLDMPLPEFEKLMHFKVGGGVCVGWVGGRVGW